MKPPLLSDDEIYEIYYESRNANQETPADIADDYGKAVARAQRDLCIKHYEVSND